MEWKSKKNWENYNWLNIKKFLISCVSIVILLLRHFNRRFDVDKLYSTIVHFDNFIWYGLNETLLQQISKYASLQHNFEYFIDCSVCSNISIQCKKLVLISKKMKTFWLNFQFYQEQKFILKINENFTIFFQKFPNEMV